MWAGKNNFMLVLCKKSLSWTFSLSWLQAAVEFLVFWQASGFRRGGSDIALLLEHFLAYFILAMLSFTRKQYSLLPFWKALLAATSPHLWRKPHQQVAVCRLLCAGFVVSCCPFSSHFLMCPWLRERSFLPAGCLCSTFRLTLKVLQEFFISPAAPGSISSILLAGSCLLLGDIFPCPKCVSSALIFPVMCEFSGSGMWLPYLHNWTLSALFSVPE